MIALTTGLDEQVERLVLYGGLAKLNKSTMGDIRMVVQLCSGTLTSICLAELTLAHSMMTLGRFLALHAPP